ncbi:MAG: hypothetical protein NTY19_06845 [Planctomycetota bacterium]|nr:hypothetical protein [Planctomycetota bacterium]
MPLHGERSSELRRCLRAARRFNRLDPFSGNRNDPLSLHKYAYVHAGPINGVDPSGQFLSGMISAVISGYNRLGSASTNLGILAYVKAQSVLLAYPTLTTIGLWGLNAYGMYRLLFHPEDRDVFLAMLGVNPMLGVQMFVDDLSALYSGAKAIFGRPVLTAANFMDEANDVLSAVGSLVHPNVPMWAQNQPARGIMRTVNGFEVPLRSGIANPGEWLMQHLPGGKGSGLNAQIPTHVEGHAVAIMHKYGLTEARLFINKPPCATGAMCRYNLHKLLPTGSELRIRFPGEDGVLHEWLFKSGVPLWEVLL